MLSDFSTINLIKDLHENKGIEYKSIVESSVWCPQLVWTTEFYSKQI